MTVNDRGSWLIYVLAILALPLAVWVATRSVMRAVLCAVVYLVAFGVGAMLMAVLLIRSRSPRWSWAGATLGERTVTLVGIVLGALYLLAVLIVAVFVADRSV